MNALEIAKAAASMVVGIGTSKIVHSVIDNNVDTVTVVDKVTVAAGSIVIGSMVGEATKKHLDTQIQAVVDKYHSIKNKQND